MKPSKSAARRYALQALYQWQYTQESADTLLTSFLEENDVSDAELDYLKALVAGSVQEVDRLDEQLTSCLDRPLAKLNPVELAVLRLAVFEFLERPEIPYKVVINEAVELAKSFGAEGGHKYINGVLDKLASTLRPHG